MKYLIQSARAMGVTLANLFRPVTTEHFGRPSKSRGGRYRNSFALLHDPIKEDKDGNALAKAEELCIACTKCELICPSDIITVTVGTKAPSPITGKNRGYLEDFTLDMNACIFCELCVQVCPVDAIVMCQEATEPAFFREDLVLTMDKLYANETSKPAAWATGSKLVDMQDPNRLSPEQQAAKDLKMAEAAAKKAELAALKAQQAAEKAELEAKAVAAAPEPEAQPEVTSNPASEPAAEPAPEPAIEPAPERELTPAEVAAEAVAAAEKAELRARRKLQREVRNAKRAAKKEALEAGKSAEASDAAAEAAGAALEAAAAEASAQGGE